MKDSFENFKRVLDGKSIYELINNSKIIHQFSPDTIDKDDVIMWHYNMFKHPHEKIWAAYKDDSMYHTPLVSITYFTNFKWHGKNKKYHVVTYDMLHNINRVRDEFHGYNLYLKNIDDDKQDLNANYIKVKEEKLTLRHEGGVSPNQLNNCLLIKTFNINSFINWPLRNPMEVKE